ncbi:MAG: hypothetical protein ACD_2C00014G0001 [uncultured bacterium (gcode 4)]|uniref:Uncharacterized protein n=1 Tax=uncultured bacterium (gcode 4) TaxID=1234023 RepID=K2G7D7_9BACT|nr:MAG: hypothetical protein ACD_2C00014G0001 [uncultured bacterium (gcode 4)]
MDSSSSLLMNLSMKKAITLARKITNEFMTHCTKVIVTMSQLTTCAISCAITHSISLWFMVSRSHVEIATNDLFLLGHVAKAFGSGDSYIQNSGILIPALSENSLTLKNANWTSLG